MNEIQPLAYGYMRMPCDADDQVIRILERRLKTYAEEHGFCFATIFHEHQSSTRAAWDELATELRRADAHHVIVPSLSHVSSHSILRISMLSQLEEDAKAEVLELSDR